MNTNNKQNNDQFITEKFWEIIDRAGKSAEKLRTILNELEADEIYNFQDQFVEAALELRSARFIKYLNVNITEDGLEDLSNWVVSQGKDYFQAIIKNPSKIPSYPDEKSAPDLFYIAYEVYEEKFGEELNIP